VTPAAFRRLALGFPDAEESSHMGHPDFRVGGRIFATLALLKTGQAMIKLPPEAQEAFMAAQPGVFTPASGAWGRAGCTLVRLREAKPGAVKAALTAAWDCAAANAPRNKPAVKPAAAANVRKK
jgi:hypothetical protein